MLFGQERDRVVMVDSIAIYFFNLNSIYISFNSLYSVYGDRYWTQITSLRVTYLRPRS